MSKSHSDGGFQCKLFLHINRSNEYTNYTISIPFEHFSGVSVVYRLSSAVRLTRFQLVEVVPLHVGLGHGLDPPEVLAAGLRIEDAHPALWCAVIG